MRFRYLAIQALIGPTLRPARTCLSSPAFTTSNTSFSQRLIPRQSFAFSAKSKPNPHSLPVTIQNTAQTDPRYIPLDRPDLILARVREILQNPNAITRTTYGRPDAVDYRLESALAIRDSLEEYNLSQWGFVIFRCTYRSQEKWDKFVAIAKRHAREYFEERGMQSVHDRMQWTIIEDAAELDGADIVETSRRFEEWVNRGPGRQEMEGTKFSPTWHYSPRYTTFLHVDEESLESVVDDVKAREEGGYSCKIVNGGAVMLEDNALLAAKDRPEIRAVEEVDEFELQDFRKRVKIDDLVGLYASLQVDINGWYTFIMDGDIIVY